MLPPRACVRERFVLALGLGIALTGCTRGVPSAVPEHPDRSKVAGGSEPSAARVTFAHEPGSQTPTTSRSEVSISKVIRQENYLLEFGAYQAEIDPVDGGRIVAFRAHGQNGLLERSQSPEAYGSSFWPSPQSAWRWPPPYEFDRLGWQAKVDGERLQLESLTNAELGLRAGQTLFADLEREALVIEYTLENRGKATTRVAPWQNSRMPPSGLTFFPSEAGSLPPSSLIVKPEAGVVWMQHDPAKAKEGKVFADGAEGWLAHLTGDLLFVKVFPDVPRERQAPEEAEIEIYVHGSGRFVEVEQQGEYGELSPGAHSTWTVRWLLRQLPDTVARVPGQQLLEYTRNLAASVRAK